MTTQLEHFLNYYKKTESPGYAVLVTGEWGTGKTFQVQQCFLGRASDGTSAYSGSHLPTKFTRQSCPG